MNKKKNENQEFKEHIITLTNKVDQVVTENYVHTWSEEKIFGAQNHKLNDLLKEITRVFNKISP